jgi:hypothetical protein
MAYLEAHTPLVLRKVHEFVTDMHEQTLTKTANQFYLRNSMPSEAMLYH